MNLLQENKYKIKFKNINFYWNNNKIIKQKDIQFLIEQNKF